MLDLSYMIQDMTRKNRIQKNLKQNHRSKDMLTKKKAQDKRR